MCARLSIVIPNWNGEAFLARCLAGTIQSARSSGYEHEILVIDDCSTDRSPEMVRHDFPSVQLVSNPANLGFGATSNRGAKQGQGDILILLNNDLIPKEAMIGELAKPILDSSRVFGVSAKTIDWEREEPNHVNMTARWNKGTFEVVSEDSDAISPTMFLQGGACAVRREEFLRLGGFCELFRPGYWEDYDVSYLALKAGWENLYNPSAMAHHLGRASMNRAFIPEFLAISRIRNSVLFEWLNITDTDLLQANLASLPARAARACWNSGVELAWLKGFLRAVRMAGKVRAERLRRKPLIRCSDREILARFAAGGLRTT